MRVRKIKDVENKIQEFNKYVIFNPMEYKGTWNKLFKNDNPIFLEIGMGKGKFISENAKLNPNINYIGCELITSIVYKAARDISELNLSNLLLINIDASLLSECFEKGEIKKIFLNFSDPWPKTRHEKRRLTSEAFLDNYKKLLVDEGVIEFKTDNRKLFEYSVMKFNELNYEFLDLSLDLHNSEIENIVTTEYEDKFILKKQIIYYIKVRIK